MTKTQQKIPHPDKYRDWQPFDSKLKPHQASDYPLVDQSSTIHKLKLFFIGEKYTCINNEFTIENEGTVSHILRLFLHPIRTIKAFIEIFFPHFYDKHINKIYTYDPAGFGFQEKYQKSKANKK